MAEPPGRLPPAPAALNRELTREGRLSDRRTRNQRWRRQCRASVTLAELDASMGSGPKVPEDEIAVRYYSDEALLSAIRLRRSDRTAGYLSWWAVPSSAWPSRRS